MYMIWISSNRDIEVSPEENSFKNVLLYKLVFRDKIICKKNRFIIEQVKALLTCKLKNLRNNNNNAWK